MTSKGWFGGHKICYAIFLCNRASGESSDMSKLLSIFPKVQGYHKLRLKMLFKWWFQGDKIRQKTRCWIYFTYLVTQRTEKINKRVTSQFIDSIFCYQINTICRITECCPIEINVVCFMFYLPAGIINYSSANFNWYIGLISLRWLPRRNRCMANRWTLK